MKKYLRMYVDQFGITEASFDLSEEDLKTEK